MARIIDSSNFLQGLEITHSFGNFMNFKCRYIGTGIFEKAKEYVENDIESIVSIDEENYRSAGKAVAGAIIGGVLTGGMGFLVGAAIGGRGRKNTCVMVVFNDGEYVVFEEKKSGNIKALKTLLAKEDVKNRLKGS